MRLWPRVLAVAVLAAAVAGGCGGEGGEGDSALTVSAAASLTEAFEAYGEALPGEEAFSFAGSDELAAQIRAGARPDVFASANARYPEELHAEGLADAPVVFARNRLVLAVPNASPMTALRDAERPGIALLIGAGGVPVGDYTHEVLGRLPEARREAVLANVRSEEPDVKGIVGKLVQGAADAGFVYASDVAAAGEELHAIELAEQLEPGVAYGVAAVDGAGPAAQEFIDGLLAGEGAQALRDAAFLPPHGR